MDNKILNFSQYISESEKYTTKISKISEDGDEVLVFTDNIKSLLSFVGNGIYDIKCESLLSPQTQEYTNSVVVEFEEGAIGNISLEEWNKVSVLLDSFVGKDGFEEYIINSSHNKVTLEFTSDMSMGW